MLDQDSIGGGPTPEQKVEPTPGQTPDGAPPQSRAFPSWASGHRREAWQLLAALETVFSAMPSDRNPGMAFVLVQHLAPDHESLLPELLGRQTRMEVFQAEDGMQIERDRVYVIPPNRDMSLSNGRLRLTEPDAPRGQRLPIDFFFRSLAKDQRSLAICVIMSGTASDGTLGLRMIKGEGGMAMVQDPETTEYSGMPRSAIGTG